MNLSFLNTHHIPVCLLASMIVGAASMSCSDDSIDSPETADSRIVSFAIAETSSWNKTTSRSGSAGETLTLSSGDTQLFLHPTVTPGISLKADGRAVTGISRGTLTSTADIESFGVFASRRADGEQLTELSPEYMYNVEITASNAWKPAEEYLWPGLGSLHINAYSPFASEASAEGVTRLPALSDKSPLTLDYNVAAEVADQEDLLYATPVDGSSSPCKLTFNHALTAIRFATGAKMTPCTVKSITISGVASSGTLSLEDGTWSDLSGDATYTVTTDLTIEAAEGSQYAAANLPLTTESQTFLLIPQTLPEDAKIELTIAVDGKESNFTAPLSGSVWTEGTTLTYHLSASPLNPGLLLEVVDADGNPLSSLSAKYTGGTSDFKVRSLYDDGTGAGTYSPIDWTATLIDADGNTVATNPDWISSVTTSGSGETAAKFVAGIKEPLFLAMSDNTRTLRNTADINTTSGHTPYNLSNSSGAPAVENSANCYIINAPGHYSLPLVYGNAITGGAKNEDAYISTLSATTANKRVALFHFINHLGNEISDPYIYNNASCTPHDAVLKWEDRLNLVRNVSLSSDGHSIVFDVPAASICQGNAMIAVRDASGTVMWSWHIWVTDYKTDNGYLPVARSDGQTSYIAERNIGTIFGGDRTEYEASSLTLRITQANVPDGLTPLTLDIRLEQSAKTVNTDDCYAFYQFGRKDPIATGLDQYYDGDHNEISGNNIPKETVADHESHTTIITKSITEPEKFFIGSETQLRTLKPYYVNLWDIDQIHKSDSGTKPENVKTIYDPSPAGSKVPVGNVFTTLADESTPYTFDSSTNVSTFNIDGTILKIPAFGYRSANGGETGNHGSGECWSSAARSATTALYLTVNSTGKHVRPNLTLYGFAVRPVKE